MLDHREIWAIATGVYPEVGKKVCNPLRSDTHPGCSFEWQGDYLRLKDFGNRYYHNMNAFDAVCMKIQQHKIGEYGDSAGDLRLVMDFLSRQNIKEAPPSVKTEFKYELTVEGRPISLEEERYFLKFGITKSHLIEDHIEGCKMYSYNSRAHPNEYKVRYPQGLAFIMWRGTRKKVYRPEQKEAPKFSTDTTADDYYVFGSGGPAMIFEGYKDARIAYNLGFNSVGLQSSTVVPKTWGPLLDRFDELIYVGDWDKAGLDNGDLISKGLKRPKYFQNKNKDVGEFFTGYGPERTKAALEYFQATARYDPRVL